METTQIQKFLEVLFPQLTDSFIELRCIRPPKDIVSDFYGSIKDVINEMPQDIAECKGYNVYFGVCLRSKREGNKDAVKQVKFLWADIDWKDYAGGQEEALSRLKEFPLKPTAIVCSGHGYQPYWCLKEVVTTNSSDDVVRVESFLKRLAIALGADSNAAEIARVLRLPGTYNLKDPSVPVPVSILQLEEDLKYSLSDFEPFLPVLSTSPKSTNPPGWISQVLNELKEGNRDGTFAKIAGRLNRDGWLPDDILSLLTPHAKHCEFPIDRLRKEVEGICQRYPSNKSFLSPSYNSRKTEMESGPLEAVSLKWFLESGKDEDVEWHVYGLLPKGSVGILAGPPGYGKSWMLLDLAIECARGGEWLQHFPASQCRVLYLDEESSVVLLRKRLKKLLGAKEPHEGDLDLHFCVGQGICLTDLGSVERLKELINTLRPGLVIIDSLIRVHGAEENSASEMSRVFAVVKDLVREFGCTFLFADHHRKPGHFGVSQDILLRGSTEKAAFVDSLLSLHRKGEILVVEHSKSRFGEAVTSFAIKIEDPKPETTVVAYVGEAEALKQQAREEVAREFLMSMLSNDWITRKSLVEQGKEAGVSEKAIDEALLTMLGEGCIERKNEKQATGKGGKSAFYCLKKDQSPSPTQETEREIE